MGTFFCSGLGTSIAQRVYLCGHVCGTNFARECELAMEYGKSDESQEWMDKQEEHFERTERHRAEDDFIYNGREVC